MNIKKSCLVAGSGCHHRWLHFMNVEQGWQRMISHHEFYTSSQLCFPRRSRPSTSAPSLWQSWINNQIRGTEGGGNGQLRRWDNSRCSPPPSISSSLSLSFTHRSKVLRPRLERLWKPFSNKSVCLKANWRIWIRVLADQVKDIIPITPQNEDFPYFKTKKKKDLVLKWRNM